MENPSYSNSGILPKKRFTTATEIISPADDTALLARMVEAADAFNELAGLYDRTSRKFSDIDAKPCTKEEFFAELRGEIEKEFRVAAGMRKR